jgi:predicted dehydrogenase
MPLKVAHIGAGRFCREAHAPALRRLTVNGSPQLVLAGICDLDAGRPERAVALARDFAYARAYAGWREMIADVAPDLVVCTVAPPKTAMVLRDLLPLRVPILAEKPQALTMADACELARLAAEHRTPVYVAFNRRRMPALERARAWAQQNVQLRSIRVEMIRVRPIKPGFCVLTAVHAFDTIRYLAGDVVDMQTYRRPSVGGSGTDYLVRLQLASGTFADVVIAGERSHNRESYVLQSGIERLDVTVSAPYSDASFWAGVRLFRENRMVEEASAPADPLVASGVLPQYEKFLACLRGEDSLDCSLADARHSLQIAVAAEAGACGPP